MKRLILGLAASLLMLSNSNAQTSDFNDDFFLSFHMSSYVDAIWSPLRMQNAPTGNTIIVDGQMVPEYRDIPTQSFGLNVFSFGFEPRYNIYQIDENSALALASPISIGLGQVSAPPSEIQVGAVEGFGTIQIPLLAKMYVGTGATYETEKDYGVSLGFGLEYNKLGLIRLDNVNEPGAAENKGFVLPIASLGFHFWRGYSPVEINVKYGHGRINEFYVNRFGDPIITGNGITSKGTARSRSIRFSVAYLLNY